MLNNIFNTIINPSRFRGVFCLSIFLIYNYGYSQSHLKFNSTKKNFGFVKKGEIVKIKFEFTNIGKEPLLIYDYKVSCPCTIVEFSRDPVLPGKSDEIIVLFDTKTVYDRQDRTVEVISNSKDKHLKIRFKGVVVN